MVAGHSERSQAGLLYDDEYEFAECLRFAAEAPEQAAAIAAQGRAYVIENYARDHVLDEMERSLKTWGLVQ